jgi:DHA1 family bicyclomycin/chloramphenicol resistance-like MFS transporter
LKIDSESFAITLLLGMLLGMIAISMDSTLPALPAIQQTFSAGAGEVQMVLGAIMLGFITGQIAAGPLADRFGRRPMLITALSLYLVASLACALADTLWILCAARFAQGCTAVFGPVLVRAIVRDLHANEAAARLMGRVTMAFAIFPILMPLLGGFLVAWAGWRAIFWMHTLLALGLLVAVITRLPETAPAHRRSISLLQVLRDYGFLLGQKQYRAPTALAVCSQMGVTAFVTNSALVVIPVMGFSPQEYGLMFSLVMIGYISGARVGARSVMRVGIPRMLTLGSLAAATGGLSMAVLSIAQIQNGAAIALPMAIFMFGNGILIPSTTAAALSPFPTLAGLASSLQSIIHLMGGILLAFAVSLAFDGTTLPLAASIGVCGIVQLGLERYYARHNAFAPVSA